jgi:hypothetical protein
MQKNDTDTLLRRSRLEDVYISITKATTEIRKLVTETAALIDAEASQGNDVSSREEQ